MARARKTIAKRMKRLAFALALLIAAAVIVPFLVPLDTYIPQIEKLASEKLREQVNIGSLRISLVPVPQLVLKEVTIGREHGVTVGAIKVAVELRTLFQPVKVLSSVELEKVSVAQDALNKIPLWFKSDGTPQKVIVRQVILSHVRLDSPKLNLGAFGATINLSSAGDLENAKVASDDGKLKIAAKADGNKYLIEAKAVKWRSPAATPLMFDELKIRAVADSGKATIREIEGRLYGGSIKGNALLDWRDGWKLDGRLQSQQLELGNLVPLFSKDVALSGKLNATADFFMRGRNAGQLFDNPEVEADFNIQDGVLHNADLAAAARLLSQEGVSGGQTNFDELSGTLRIANRYYRFSRLKASSGSLSASGEVSISPAKQLGGRVYVELKGTAKVVTVPLVVSGTVDKPVLLPSAGALAGAAAGAAILGPAGAGLGMKAGEALERLLKK